MSELPSQASNNLPDTGAGNYTIIVRRRAAPAPAQLAQCQEDSAMLTPHQEITKDHETAHRLLIELDPKTSFVNGDQALADRAQAIYRKIGQTHESRFRNVSAATITQDRKIVGKTDFHEGLDLMDDDYYDEVTRRCMAKLEELEEKYGK